MADQAVVKLLKKHFPNEPVTVPTLKTTGDGHCFLRSILQDIFIGGYVSGNESHFKHIFSTKFIREVEQELNLTTPYPLVQFNIDDLSESSTKEDAEPFLKILRFALIDKAKVFFRENKILCLSDESEWELPKKYDTDWLFDLLISFTAHVIKRHLLIFNEDLGKIVFQSGNAYDKNNVVNNTPILLARIKISNTSFHYQILKSKNSQYWISYVYREMKLPYNDEIIQECLRHIILYKILAV